MFVPSLMFAYEETIDDEDNNNHSDYQSKDGECWRARAGVKIDGADIENRVV